MIKILLVIFKLILSHPFTRGYKLISVINFFKWKFKLHFLNRSFIVDWVNGTKFHVMKGESGLTGHLYFGLQEYEDMSFLLHFLKKTDFFYDIGANVGSYTILASGVVGCHSKCFEPVPETFNKLLDQIKLNRISSLAEARNIGVSNKNDKLDFTNNLNCMNHVSNDPSSKNITEVNVIALDTTYDPISPSIAKLDVEAHEKFVMDGGKNFSPIQMLLR